MINFQIIILIKLTGIKELVVTSLIFILLVRLSLVLNVAVVQPRALPVGLPAAAERSEQDKTSGVQYGCVKFRRHHFLPAHDESVHRHVLCVTLSGCLGVQIAPSFRAK